MTAMERSARIGAAVLLVAALAGCTASESEPAAPTGPVVQLGAPGEPPRTLSPEEAGNLGAPGFVEADVDFVRGMVEHHAQALVMTDLVDDRTDDRDIRLLAERMHVSQESELDLMRQWLQNRVQPLEGDHEGHGGHGDGGMPGMLTDEQLAELEAAEGEEFERLFLEYMIQHHTGAIEMVEDLYASGGGQESEVDQFARHVESDQSIEIGRMSEMLAERMS